MWLRDFHVDGLRLDAVHALQDDSDPRTSWPSSRRESTTLHGRSSAGRSP